MAVAPPTDWPVASRQGLAVARLKVVDRRDGAALLCDGLHTGLHFWPDDAPARPLWDEELDASLAEPPDHVAPAADEASGDNQGQDAGAPAEP